MVGIVRKGCSLYKQQKCTRETRKASRKGRLSVQSLTVKGIAICSRQGGTLPGDDAMWAKTIRADGESRALVPQGCT